jgi:hypothetical protein
MPRSKLPISNPQKNILSDIPSKGNYLKAFSLMNHKFMIKSFKPIELTSIVKSIS